MTKYQNFCWNKAFPWFCRALELCLFRSLRKVVLCKCKTKECNQSLELVTPREQNCAELAHVFEQPSEDEVSQCVEKLPGAVTETDTDLVH